MECNANYPNYMAADWIHPEDCGCLSSFVVDREFSAIEHSHNFYEFVTVFSGEVNHKINGVPQKTMAGEIWMICPGTRHIPIRNSEHLEVSMFSVRVEYIEPFIAALDLETSITDGESGIRCSPGNLQMHLLHAAFEELQFLSGKARELQLRIICGTILQFFAERKLQNQSRSSAWVNKILLEMRKPENLAIGVPAIEKLSNMSRAQLCRVFKQYMNQTPHEFVLEARLSYAYHLICNTNLSFELVANKVGYASLSHFSMIFRERFNCSPAELKRKTLKFS